MASKRNRIHNDSNHTEKGKNINDDLEVGDLESIFSNDSLKSLINEVKSENVTSLPKGEKHPDFGPDNNLDIKNTGMGSNAKVNDATKPEDHNDKSGMRNDTTISLGRLQEQKSLKKETKSFQFELSLDILDCLLKSLDFYVFLGSVEEQGEFYNPLLISLTLALFINLCSSMWRIREILEMGFVIKYGYSLRWKKGERIVGNKSGGQDPRVKRDIKVRLRRQKYLSSLQAFFSDLPWITIGIIQGSLYVLNTFGVLSIANSAFGFGMKFANIIELIKEGFKKRVPLYTVCPAEIKVGTGCSYDEDPEDAMETAYLNSISEIGEGRDPCLALIFMTANVEHEKALATFKKLTEGKVPFSGCTICRGAMMGSQCRQRSSMRLISIWTIYDPEGLYEVGMADLSQASGNSQLRRVVKQSVKVTDQVCRRKAMASPNNPVIQGKPSFIWINPPPGPEDVVITAVQEGIGSTDVEIIGGTSADNDVSGAWKQWNSSAGVVSNGLPYVIARCSAQLKGCAFTGYSATPKVGKVTEMKGPRHIITIDDKPAGEVYDEWTSGHFKDLWNDPEDSNILGPSSVYPLGQVVSQDWDKENVYRTLHPHLLVKKDKSVTVFSDVYEGQEICMMAGTRENIQTKISAVATHVLRSTGIPTSELRGALVVFCAGAMLYCGTDGVDVACGKLDQALGGVNYLGIHTFGEQGPFPDGSVRHGNLMFSALVFSSRRKVMKLSNLDSDEFVLETEPKFKEIALSGGIIG